MKKLKTRDLNIEVGADHAPLQITFAELLTPCMAAVPCKAMFGQPSGPGAVADPVSYSIHIQPVLGMKCAPCHTGLGVGGHNIGVTYSDAFLNSSACPGLNIAQCALVRIQNGSMPQGAGCTGDPALDAGNAACLTQAEQNLVQLWLDHGVFP